MRLCIGESTSALISFTHDCQEALDCGDEVCSVFFDLSKAFSTVPHEQLLHKNSEIHVDPFLIRWVRNFLAVGCTRWWIYLFTCRISGHCSGLYSSWYTLMVSTSATDSNITIYADDIALYKIIRLHVAGRHYINMQLDSRQSSYPELLDMLLYGLL